ncbi:MAG: hypothetical protein M1840_008880 [Geoglossum simile]|nr:MAG: hypothetical protein M1840_008880 [Geoglossum simile]
MFNVEGNLFSNQRKNVTEQLNDGIRILQGQVHKQKKVLHFCHTDCKFLDAGPIIDYFTMVANWINSHPNDVVTIILGNGDCTPVSAFKDPLQKSGLASLAYIPPKVPMRLDDWPTLGELIDSGKRVIIFMDYKADQTRVPYVLNQFSQLWETPFSPTNRSFPCNTDRPSKLDSDTALNTMYITNHNLNTGLRLQKPKVEFLLPHILLLPITNGMNGYGSLGKSVAICSAIWNHPPNVLLVDFYEFGLGSVFEVAAIANGVVYSGKCCDVWGNSDS